MLIQNLFNVAVGKYLLNCGLGIVKVAFYSADPHVAALLGCHLPFLHGAYPSLGIEYQNPGSRHVTESLQGSLARIAGGGNQNDRFFFLC